MSSFSIVMAVLCIFSVVAWISHKNVKEIEALLKKQNIDSEITSFLMKAKLSGNIALCLAAFMATLSLVFICWNIIISK